jgi:GTP cyclohydrolase I
MIATLHKHEPERPTLRLTHPETTTQARLEQAVYDLLEALGEDPNREGLRDTPQRVASVYRDLFAGLRDDPAKHLQQVLNEAYDEIVLLRDVEFSSLCEHHLLPFHGRAHVAYLPDGRVAGLPKLARTVEAFARRPQVQERLTCQIADAIMEHLAPKGAAVLIEAEHVYMQMRGVQQPNGVMVTSAMRGIFEDSSSFRSEVMALINDRRP